LNEALHILGEAAFLGAIHDSAERYPPQNCHPNTREAVRKTIMDWIPKVSCYHSSGFMELQVSARRRSSKQSQRCFAVHPDLMRLGGAAFSLTEESLTAIEAIFCSQQSHVNWR
jgi:hypothetical protein